RNAPEYISAAAMLDGQLKTFQREADYLDIMLVNLKGEIVYVTNKEHAERDLGEGLPGPDNAAFEQGLQGIHLSKLFMNNRENDIPSMLITAPVHNFYNELIGVIALEIDMAPIYHFIQKTQGLGKTGETLIGKKMGNAVRFLNPLRHDPSTALKKTVFIGSQLAIPIQKAVQGYNGSGRSVDYRNKEIISVWRYIPSLDWGLMTKIDTEEAFEDVVGLRIYLLTVGTVLLIVVGFISSAFSKSITLPIASLQNGMETVTQGNLDFKVEVDSGGEIAALSRCFNQMVTEIKKRNKDLNDFKFALDEASIVAITDQTGKIQYVNDKFCEISKYSREELIGQDHRIVNSGSHSSTFIKNMWTTIASGKVWLGNIKNQAKDGSIYWVATTIVPFLNKQGKPYQYLSIRTNITQQKHAEEEIKRMALYDDLTGLPNRTLFNERLNQTLKQRHWEERPFAVIFLDLDRFKLINDTLGHAAGDQLLQKVSLRLTRCLREEDTVSRMGGDEFTILLPAIAKKEDALLVAEKMIATLKEPYEIAEHELFITGSIGISLYPDDGNDAETLKKNADAAMYQAKQNGRGRFASFTPGLLIEGRSELDLDSALHHALDRKEFSLHYQPLIDLGSGKVIGMEALIRWQNEKVGFISPEKFIPLAEKTGLILPMGDWILETATRQIKKWDDAGFTDLTVSVNVSALQFQQPDFADHVSRIVLSSGIGQSALKLEITESLLMKNQEEIIRKLQQLKGRGIHFAIDDFGTGYSSLSYLRKFPLESLKIDRSFIMNLPDNNDDAVIAETIITLGHHLGLKVVAEGIETKEQLVFLQARGCDVGQGYLFSRPLPAETFTKLLQKTSKNLWVDVKLFEGFSL
ncbi:MAG: EAL domain-containing protein, partial [Nitrospiria bacterium]